MFSTCLSFGQNQFEPQILILSPNSTQYEKLFEKEIDKYNKSVKKTLNEEEKEAVFNSDEFKEQPKNIQLIVKSEIEFTMKLDFFKQVSAQSEQYLAYRFYERFPNLLIKLKDVKCNGTINDLKALSESEQLQYVLNFSSVELYRKDDVDYAQISFQLYDNKSQSIVLDKTHIGNWDNPGFEFSCEDKSIFCCLNNSLSQVLENVINVIASDSPKLKKEKELQQERYRVLMNNYFNQPFDISILTTFITPDDDKINLEFAYQALFNEDKSKFVVFFLEQGAKKDFKALHDSNDDNSVNIISNKDLKDEDFLDDVPQTYSYVLNGVKYQDKWYFEKSQVTYFNAKSIKEGQAYFFNNLQEWNFFKENTTELNPEFWETNLFAKVPDLKKDPDWSKYGNSIWMTYEINNRPYVGLYEIVANVLRERLKKENEIFEKDKRKIFESFYQGLKTSYPENYSKLSEHALIYSTDKKAVINPVLITNSKGEKKVHYFVIVEGVPDVYEWTYFQPKATTDMLYGSIVVDQISTVTEWNFSVDNLNDSKFWNQYVLSKNEDKYIYLKLLK